MHAARSNFEQFGTISAWAAPVAVGRFGWFGLAILAASLAAS